MGSVNRDAESGIASPMRDPARHHRGKCQLTMRNAKQFHECHAHQDVGLNPMNSKAA
jgi:hypothetical protein